jgi:cell wall assembly regulator SMI1
MSGKIDDYVKECWEKFIQYLSEEERIMLCLPVTEVALDRAQSRLDCQIPPELRTMYMMADGFQKDAFLLRDDYRVLTLEEMILESEKKPLVVIDEMAGEFEEPDRVTRLIFAVTEEDNRDIQQVSLHLDEDDATVEIWFKEGGIHDFEEVVDTELSLGEWLEECLEYYG